ncbi:YciI family protein [Thalassolituus alkanivorans]|uniref:YciI family protein n=1 Tax=Thalassolituus alkanivorans TaxID=2881055 RepID=UPI001E501EEF|nr:YciI family protein [Thalassolituus alkanivorans]MCB2385967.1 YciI family protein [Thalassolituus alkanivorans]MCB2422594.1 YciI family protein [Thalassolituus alkanivorans]
MFIVLLRFSQNKAQAAAFMDGHNEWLRQGFAEGVFLLAGSLQPGLGGALIAHGITRDALEARVNQDPFVAENIVSAEILDIDPKKADERLSFLLN